MGRTVGLHFQDDGGGFYFAVQRLAKGVGQAHWLQANAKIAARNAAFLQKRVYYGFCGGSRNRDCAEAREARSGDTEDAAVSVDCCAARSDGLDGDV